MRDGQTLTFGGATALPRAITALGEPWLKGIGKVYDWYVKQLTGSPYENFAVEIRDRWRKRMSKKHWPEFTAV
jgi:hypothetical protein